MNPEERSPAEITASSSGPLRNPWVREARLRAQYSHEYPGITPGIWMPVSELAAKLMERVQDARKEGRYTRTFDPTHFEFRGGTSGPRPRAARTRSTDPKL